MRKLAPILPLSLTGCEGSAAWYMSHPQKQIVEIGGQTIHVVPNGPDQYDAWGNYSARRQNAAILKQQEVIAIELVSKCKVVAAEYKSGGDILQAKVACG